MTAIAYRDGVLAADSMVGGGNQIFGTDRKLWRRLDGALMGAVGRSEIAHPFRELFMAGLEREFICVSKDNEDFGALVVYADGQCWAYGVYGRYPLEQGPFTAMGSADVFLMGAMAAGASAEEAVALAIAWRKDIGGPVQVERLGDRA